MTPDAFRSMLRRADDEAATPKLDRAELVRRCRSILRNDPWDDNAVANSAEKLATLLIELTGGNGAAPHGGEPRPLFSPAPPPKT